MVIFQNVILKNELIVAVKQARQVTHCVNLNNNFANGTRLLK